MKFQVILRSFGVPILLAVLLVIRFLTGVTPFRAMAETVFFLAVLSSRLLADDRYVHTFSVGNGRLVIVYLTKYLNLKTVERPLTDIEGVKLSRRWSLSAVWSPTLELKTNGEWTGFHVVTAKLYRDVQQQLAGQPELMAATTKAP